ncbi:hypothetical protein CYMTET_32525 [Cymbomonas tetramitiformis]|uniref:Uncharacterized protein n=1 Tax=Cymbomonas tetramitiformis TaxID=36881 RepID=A0AAE0KS48_9CHLO|nr:hypothetical protein CYMTET_32525 [Cymbomonas tetramitiformis]
MSQHERRRICPRVPAGWQAGSAREILIEVSAAGAAFDSTQDFLDIRFEANVDPQKKNADFNTAYTLASWRNTFDPELVKRGYITALCFMRRCELKTEILTIAVVLSMKAQLSDIASQVKKLQGMIDGKGHTVRREQRKLGVVPRPFAWRQRRAAEARSGPKAGRRFFCLRTAQKHAPAKLRQKM